MRFFNAENVSKTVARLAEQMGSSTSVITAAHNRGAIPPRSQGLTPLCMCSVWLALFLCMLL